MTSLDSMQNMGGKSGTRQRQKWPWRGEPGSITATWKMSSPAFILVISGPWGLPVVGAVSCFSDNLAEKLLRWRQKYGDVISYYRLGKLHIVLNSEKSIRDAFSKQGDEFGHRLEEADVVTMGLKDDIFSAPYDHIWKTNKKFAHSMLRRFGVGTAMSVSRMQNQFEIFEEFLMKQNGALTDVSDEVRLVSTAVSSSVILGTSDSWHDSDLINLVNLTVVWERAFNTERTALNMWKGFLHPKLAHFMVKEKRTRIKKAADELAECLVVKIKNAEGDVSASEPQSMIDVYLQEQGTGHEEILQIAHSIISLLPGSIQGTSAVMLWCIVNMSLHPELQQQMYKEISIICGSDRVPSLSDRDKLPSTQALIHETLRLMHSSSLPLSFKRVLHQEVHLYGFTLPKGSVVAANNYSVLFDSQVFPDPDKFLASRFINHDGTFNTILGAKVLAFSLGPRKCPGEAFARQLIYLFVARMVQRFEVRPDPAAPTPTREKTYETPFPRPQRFKVHLIPH